MRKTSQTHRRRPGRPPAADGAAQRQGHQPAPSRIGKVPNYGLPAASGATEAGYNSLNRKRKLPKYYPAQVKPKKPAGPGSPEPPKEPAKKSAGQLRLSVAAVESANKPPMPPAMAGNVDGQPVRKRMKVDNDPFGAVGDYAGSFLIKSAVEVAGGYDTNPGRIIEPQGSPYWVVAPEFLAVSNWERHALVADLRGSFTGYGGSLSPIVDGGHLRRRPMSIGRTSPAISTAASTSRMISISPRKCACASRPTIPAAPTSRPGWPNIRSTPPWQHVRDRSAFNRLQMLRPAAPSTAPTIRTPKLTDGTSPPTTTATSTNMAGWAASVTS